MLVALENADEILQILDRFTKQKSKDIPAELEEYINYVAKTGDTVYRWPTVQYLFREKLRNVIKEFHDTTASIEDLPQCPNVDQFNYESMKTLLFERFDNFQAAPFTIQRLCELLTDPKKHYSRLDKFMRALEKNILVVSTVPPGRKMANGTEDNDIDTEINIDSEVTKSEEKRQNGNKEEHNELNSTEHIPEGGESSSAAQALTSEDIKIEEATKVEQDVSEKLTDAEQSGVSVEPKTETETAAVAAETVTTTGKDESKPVEAVEPAATVNKESVIPKVENAETIDDKDEKKADSSDSVKIEAEVKAEKSIEKTTSAPVGEEVKPEEGINETKPVEIEKPPTPKRRSDDEEDADVVSNGSSAKKIRLELDDVKEAEEVSKVATKAEETATTEPESAAIKEPVASSEVDLPKESDILESISTEIDAQKENELLEDVVDSTLTATEKDPINIDVKPIADAESVLDCEVPKPAEELPATEDLLKTDAPVAIPSDLDFTPDEALNELVSSDILAAIPEQQPVVVEEVKMNDEPANVVEPVVAPADEMTVENTETNTAEAENAMEAAPIKTDEEQMDVDESNSVDAMDL
ncbi:serine/threonine-protein phosphatase 4 regulatory subunit 2 [Sitodiplosis mosellana]|uniref:serine/threonine-protein phosphatase 4 regulatory subunit 2 n=1 Tax=Sitodiplosis mosellana TaxID=263140 RepID=UPI002444E3F2|nr:serine/threonine-protein phosphatase 4 regulatory subunit 2 [Sitodiplosis mosellana]XP_055307166.1 serine/threonine-protein phosphatase 4 regulatory subunit 2 [Sitodiplosis mosellana]XP_055307171.1 serine/threonine-protein phosphatase 4 regulatory subunit 2 [Sitodiplosis mosellana]